MPGNGVENPSMYRVRDVARLLGVDQSDVARLIRRGELPATKDGRLWSIDPADVERHLRAQLRVSELVSLKEAWAELERAKADLAERSHQSLLEALERIPLREALEHLAAVDIRDYEPVDRPDAYAMVVAKRQRIRRVIDIIEMPAPSVRPPHVPSMARYRMVATGTGRIPIWFWSTQTGWRAKAGGPRPGRVHTNSRLQTAIKGAITEARARYGKPNRAVSARTRFMVLRRDDFTCRYCGQTPPGVILHVDHIKPVAAGGSNDESNLITSCDDCNQGKSDTE